MIRRLGHWVELSEQHKKTAQGNCAPSAPELSWKTATDNSNHPSEPPCHEAEAPREQLRQMSPSVAESNAVQGGNVSSESQVQGVVPVTLGSGNQNDGDDQHLSSSVDTVLEKIPQDTTNETKIEINGESQSQQPASRSPVPNGLLVSSDCVRDTEKGTPVDVIPSHRVMSASSSVDNDQALPTSRLSLVDSLKEPEFPLFPMSRGFCLTLQKYLALYEKALQLMDDPATVSSDFLEPIQEKDTVASDSATAKLEDSEVF